MDILAIEETLTLPVRGVGKNIITIVYVDNIFGTTLKEIFRRNSKCMSGYKLKIKHNTIQPKYIHNGRMVSIDTLGDWIFGTPYYKGNVVFNSFDERAITVSIPTNISQEAATIIISLLRTAWYNYISGEIEA